MAKVCILISICFIIFHKIEAWSVPVPQECDDLNEDPKYVNDKCTNDTQCYGDSMVCIKGVCQCAESYLSEQRLVDKDGFRSVCVAAPFLHERCEKMCQKPLICVNVTSKHITARWIDPNYVMMDTSDFQIDLFGRICLCPPPYIIGGMTNRDCYKKCEKDEQYNYTTYMCKKDPLKKKCKPTEINLKGVCKPTADIGKVCDHDAQCKVGFTECKNKKCSCRNGFDFKNGSCIAASFKCPNGKALKKDNKIFQCRVIKERKCEGCPKKIVEESGKYSPYTMPAELFETQLSHNCPERHYCAVGTNHDTEGNLIGHCCPLQKFQCPVGQPLQNVSCDELLASSNQQYCPLKTHYCYYLKISKGLQETLCCPKACHLDAIEVDGLCYQPKNVDEPCQVDKQCSSNRAKCVKGICIADAQSSTIDCKSNEKQIANKCEKVYLAGESCAEHPERCAENSVCSKHGKCKCKCGTISVGKECLSTFSWSKTEPITNNTTFNLEDIDDYFKNNLLCKIKGIQSTIRLKNIVAICPPDQYCKKYITSLGVCEKRPEIRCLLSGTPTSTKPCDKSDPNSCGKNERCEQFIYDLADPQAIDGTVCCPKASKK